MATDFLQVCEQAARAGGKELLSWVGRFAVREKGPADLVTEADLASQEAVRRVVTGAFPDHAFLSEEDASADRSGAPYRWIVDPLDGTTNYVHQVPHYCVSIALEHAGQTIAGTVYDPVADECFSATAGGGAFLNGRPISVSTVQTVDQALVAISFPPRIKAESSSIRDFTAVLMQAQAIRRTGSAALNLCYVASGRFDAYWSKETKAWDVAAGMLLVREAGGTVTCIDGAEFNLTRPHFLAAGTAELHADMFKLVGEPSSR